MKTYKQFLNESINISGDFNGNLYVNDGGDAKSVSETYSADIIYDGQLFRIEVISENGEIPNQGDLTWALQDEYPGAMVQQIYPPHKPKVNIASSHKINVDANAHKYGAWIGICGELGADTSLTETFLRMGIDELSVSPGFVLKVREAVRKIDLSEKQMDN